MPRSHHRGDNTVTSHGLFLEIPISESGVAISEIEVWKIRISEIAIGRSHAITSQAPAPPVARLGRAAGGAVTRIARSRHGQLDQGDARREEQAAPAEDEEEEQRSRGGKGQ